MNENNDLKDHVAELAKKYTDAQQKAHTAQSAADAQFRDVQQQLNTAKLEFQNGVQQVNMLKEALDSKN